MNKCQVCGEPLLPTMACCACCGTANPEYGNKKIESTTKQEPTPAPKVVEQNDEDSQLKMIEKCSLGVVKVLAFYGDKGSSGTGWRTNDNYIVTNAHVVLNDEKNLKGLASLTCKYSDKLNLREQPMKVVAYNAAEDFAILEPVSGFIPSAVTNLPINDTKTKQGQKVFTIGNPLHYEFTYTDGSVSNPDYKSSGKDYPVIQTNIELNHGNSGGPLFNMKGEVVGMTTFFEVQRKGYEADRIIGYGFCISSIAITDCFKQIKH